MNRFTRALAATAVAATLTLTAVVPAEAAAPKIVLVAKSSSTMTVTWAANGNLAQDDHGKTWKKVVKQKRGTYYSVAVNATSDESIKVSCEVRTTAGKVLRKKTVRGKFASVRCDYTTKY